MVSVVDARPEDVEETKAVLELVRKLPPVARLRVAQTTIGELFAELPKHIQHRSPIDGLTDLQRRIFSWICDYYDVNGIMPTLAEIQVAFNYSTHKRVQVVIDRIIAHGFLSRRFHVARGLTIVRRLDEPPQDPPKVPGL